MKLTLEAFQSNNYVQSAACWMCVTNMQGLKNLFSLFQRWNCKRGREHPERPWEKGEQLTICMMSISYRALMRKKRENVAYACLHIFDICFASSY